MWLFLFMGDKREKSEYTLRFLASGRLVGGHFVIGILTLFFWKGTAMKPGYGRIGKWAPSLLVASKGGWWSLCGLDTVGGLAPCGP